MGGDLLNRVQSERAASEGRLRAEVRAQLREANRQLRIDPTGVAGSLKSLLANVSRPRPTSIRNCVKNWRRKSAPRFRSPAGSKPSSWKGNAIWSSKPRGRPLQPGFWKRPSVAKRHSKVLSQQMNALIDEGRYDGGRRPGVA